MKLLAYFCNNSVSGKIFFITFVAVLSLFSTTLYAQERDNGRSNGRFDRETFLVKRSAFITAELGLTPEEAAAFMPLCEELQKKKFEAGLQCRKLHREIRGKETTTDAEYTKAIDECLGVGITEAQLELEYYEKFKKILSPEKLYKYKHAELKFARDFMKESGDRRKDENRNK
ncbi:MAG: hypothetical protein LUG98_08735 [Tannerellaceae bacterium]|nr:hypothetical protein [Tannerellaceae bacterium]